MHKMNQSMWPWEGALRTEEWQRAAGWCETVFGSSQLAFESFAGSQWQRQRCVRQSVWFALRMISAYLRIARCEAEWYHGVALLRLLRQMPGDGVFLLFQALMKDEEREDVRTLQSQSCREKMAESLGWQQGFCGDRRLQQAEILWVREKRRALNF